jgi:UDP-2,3-diacylglucosamine hydrolase
VHALRAEPSWRVIEVLSDVHLTPDMPATFERWSAHLRSSDAHALIILGDLFEVWLGDDARHESFEARCVDVLRDASARRALFFIAGNRDFLVGEAALRDAGVTALPDPTVLEAFGSRFVLTHGDALCLDDHDYQRFRTMVRSPEWQQRFLAMPLAQRRAAARGMRDASAARQRLQPATDVDRLAAIDWLEQAHADTLIHGHTHRAGSEALGEACVRHVLSDWDFDGPMPRGDALRITGDGVQRVAA